MRKTKIICTLGPATERTEVLGKLIAKGADIFRLNMSHASHDWVREIVPRIRDLARKAGRPVAILLDTQGPAIRTGDLKTNFNLEPGDIVEFTVRGTRGRRNTIRSRSTTTDLSMMLSWETPFWSITG